MIFGCEGIVARSSMEIYKREREGESIRSKKVRGQIFLLIILGLKAILVLWRYYLVCSPEVSHIETKDF